MWSRSLLYLGTGVIMNNQILKNTIFVLRTNELLLCGAEENRTPVQTVSFNFNEYYIFTKI